LHEALDTQLRFSFAYHPETDGQTERVNQILGDMLRACALQYGRSWDKSLSYAKFSYNNSYQESLKMAPFEMLYGHRCRTPLFWNEMGERKVFGPDILEEAEKQVLRVPEEQIPMEDLDAKEYLSYQEHPIRILETSERVTRNKRIKMCKLQWSHHTEEEATWEKEEELKAEFPSFFSDQSKSWGRDSF
jgi:hypothetical protein